MSKFEFDATDFDGSVTEDGRLYLITGGAAVGKVVVARDNDGVNPFVSLDGERVVCEACERRLIGSTAVAAPVVQLGDFIRFRSEDGVDRDGIVVELDFTTIPYNVESANGVREWIEEEKVVRVLVPHSHIRGL